MTIDQSIMVEMIERMLKDPFAYQHEILNHRLKCGLSFYADWKLDPIDLRYSVYQVLLFIDDHNPHDQSILFTAEPHDLKIITNELNRSL